MRNKITIGYLYPEYMNIYGDTGNIITLKYRAEKRGVTVDIRTINANSELEPGEIDVYFFGGGQDQQQVFVSQDIQKFADPIKKDIADGAVALTICGGYQLFGEFYRPFDQNDLKGITIFPVQTHASTIRMIDNCIIKMHDELYDEIQKIYTKTRDIPSTLVGFENHSGQTSFVETAFSQAKPLGFPILGYGNNETKQTEGCWSHNAFGTYLHGSLLPKNPHFADYLIFKALEHRSGHKSLLEPLDDTLEYQGHRAIVNKYTNLIK